MADPVDVGATVDAVSATIKSIGDTAVIVLQVGEVALPILQDIGLFVPPVGVAANYLAVAIPYIQKIAQYAPAVSVGLSQNKPLIEASIGVGEALLFPLHGLLTAIPQLIEQQPFFAELDSWIKDNGFTPQDPRFNRGQESTY